MSLFNNSSRQLRRITEQSISMLKVSQNINTIQHLSFLPSKKSKTYHGRYEKYTTIKNTWHFWVQHSTRSVYLERTTNCSSSPGQRYFFIFDKEYISQSTRKVKTQKTIMCSSWSKRHSSPSNLLFLEKLLISSLTNQNLITVDSKRTEQNSFGYLKCSNPNKITIKCRCLFWID